MDSLGNHRYSLEYVVAVASLNRTPLRAIIREGLEEALRLVLVLKDAPGRQEVHQGRNCEVNLRFKLAEVVSIVKSREGARTIKV